MFLCPDTFSGSKDCFFGTPDSVIEAEKLFLLKTRSLETHFKPIFTVNLSWWGIDEQIGTKIEKFEGDKVLRPVKKEWKM